MASHLPLATDYAQPSRLMGRCCVLGAALLWSSSGLFAKTHLFDVWPEETRGVILGFWRAAFAALVLVPTIRRPTWRLMLIPLTVCFAVMNASFLSAMSLGTAANAIWLQATSPWWVFLLSVILFREPIVRRDLIPLVFGVLGVGTILSFELRGQAGVGALCGLVAGVSYAGVVVLMRQLSREDSPWLVALNHFVAAVVLFPWVVWLGQWPSPVQLVVLGCFGVVQMALPYLLMVRALRSISSQEAVAIGMLEPILIPVWAYLVRGEVPAWWTIVGAASILVGLFLRYVVWGLLPESPTDRFPDSGMPLAE